MNRKAIVLLSGGLDSTLALRILQEQGIEVEGINFKTMFTCCREDVQGIAHRFNVKVTYVGVDDDYLKLIEKPKYGYGKGINPCVDCRAYMFRIAKKFMEETGASFVASGEVLGQRPMSQQGHQLRIIERDAGLERLLLRPLSAKLLDPTIPEELGIVDRNQLYEISGRSRHELLELAGKYGIDSPPTPSTGCALTQPEFAEKVRDIFQHNPNYRPADFELLKIGRHFRLDEKTKLIVGRDEVENRSLGLYHEEQTIFFEPASFISGPSALLVENLGEYQFSKLGIPPPRHVSSALKRGRSGVTARPLFERGDRWKRGEAPSEPVPFSAPQRGGGRMLDTSLDESRLALIGGILLCYSHRYDPQNAWFRYRNGQLEKTFQVKERVPENLLESLRL